ncbi:MAG TPA: response regulator transcription factor, partial [Ilumatobacteraceae bacterium]
ITLDLGLPDYDGLDLCRRLRRTQRCPIIVVSGDGDEDVMIAALDSGADDYVVKPVSADLLMARVRVVLRHANALASALGQTTFTVGDLFLDVEAHLLTIAGHTVDVSPRQFRLLTALLRNEGRVLTHRQLSMAAGGDASDVANADGLRGALSHLRKRIGTGPQRPSIITEPHIGYRLLAPE